MRTLLRHGTIVNADGRRRADVLAADGRIVAIGTGLRETADRVIDVTGRWLLPGGVDVHTHLDMPLGDIRTADDFTSGTVAAACGGTTTVIDYATQTPGGSLHDALDAWMRRAAGRAVIDFGFHMGISDLREDVEAEIEGVVAAGVPSFKLFMAYPGRLMLNDGEIFRVLRRTAACGGLVCLHAENGAVIDVLVREALAAGRTGPRFHTLTRPPEVEAEAVHRGIVLARLAGAPLYVVHLSSAEALDEVSAARARGQRVLAETCPQYLLLSAADEPDGNDDFAGARTVMSPPLRDRAAQDALWAGLARGDLQVVATDHCPFTLGQKARGRGDFSKIPNGAPGIEHRMALLLDAVVRTGRLSLERMVEVTTTAPARIFGLYPRKGVIAEGSDADLVVFDPAGATTVSAATHQMRVDYNLYEGRTLSGAIDMVMARGEVVVERGRFVGPAGGGRFLKRAPVSPEAFVRP
jgi:dihydropyrimidinase